jgi:hypothetical protein
MRKNTEIVDVKQWFISSFLTQMFLTNDRKTDARSRFCEQPLPSREGTTRKRSKDLPRELESRIVSFLPYLLDIGPPAVSVEDRL